MAAPYRISTKVTQLRLGVPSSRSRKYFQEGPCRDPKSSSRSWKARIMWLSELPCIISLFRSALKAWIDHIVRVRRTFNTSKDGYVGVLRDRPVFVAVSSGGRYSGERARQPDFLTPYLKTVLGVIGLHDLTFFSVEGSSLGLDALADARARVDRTLQEYFSSCDFEASQ